LAVAVAAGVVIAATSAGGSGHRSTASSSSSAGAVAQPPPLALHGHDAHASGGVAAGGAAAPGAHSSPGASAGTLRAVAETRDPEEARSFPVSPGVRARYHNATTPTRAADAFVAPGALSTAQVRKDLAQEQALERALQSGQGTIPGGDSVGGNGTIPIPSGVPGAIQQVIAGANAITDLPYVYGGGHASFVDNAYDCSGSVSYALAAAGLLSAPETSGELESWGAPGPGKWITVYASGGHVYMYVNIGGAWMRYDTVGRSGPFASRWQPSVRSNEGFVARHWPGL
jgi:cell wall-associated NlpC family hydrolase